jgi:hypothetical protein
MLTRRIATIRLFGLLGLLAAGVLYSTAWPAPTPPRGAAALTDSTTTLIFVRHGEKTAEPSTDPPLSPAGEARARALVEALRGAGVQAVYATATKRAQMTAAPVAAMARVPVTTFGPPTDSKTYGEDYVREIMTHHRGHVVLVVGHSNTIPIVLRALGVSDGGAAAATPAMSTNMPDDYDPMCIVTVPAQGANRLICARYGAPG